MRRWLTITFSLLILLVLTIPVQAQSGLSFSSVNVSLLPEYDQSNMLVFLEMQLAADTQYPATVTIKLPGRVDKPYVVAIGPSLDTVSDQGIQFSYEKIGNWLELTVVADTPAIRIEYYDPQLLRTGNQRSYTYTWNGDYATDNFSVAFQAPPNATNVVTTPDLGSPVLTNQGLPYYQAEAGALAAGESINISIQYDKADEVLTLSGQAVQPTEPLGTQSWTSSLDNILPWLAGGLGLILVVGGIIYFQRTSQGSESHSRKRHSKGRKASGAGVDENVYCHECGKRAQPSDRFCRTCGVRLRN